MRNQNLYLSGIYAQKQQQRCWDAFCKSGSIADYLQYRGSFARSEGSTDDNASDRPRTGDPGNTGA